MGQFVKAIHRNWIAAFLVVLLVSTGFGLQSNSAAAGPSWRFSAYDNVGNTAGLTKLSSTLPQPIALGSDYFDERSWAGVDSDMWLIQRWRATNLPMVWGVPMLPSTGGVSLATGATGAYNSYFSLLASNLVANGQGSSTLRLGWEFNMPSFPWFAAGQAPAFVAYWQQIVNTMRAVPGANFTFEWNVSRGAGGWSDKAMGNFDNYYPGDAYVDVVGLDVYDQAWNTYPGPAQEFQNIQAQPWGLNWISGLAAAHGKAMAIPELGLGVGPSAPNSGVFTATGPVCGGDNPAFITDMMGWAAANHVRDVGFWDYGPSSIDNGANPLTAAALRQALANMVPITSPTTTIPPTTTTVPPTTTTVPVTTTTVPPTTTVPVTTTTIKTEQEIPRSLYFVTSGLPNGHRSAQYSTLILAYGARAPYTFTTSDGLPSGLKLRIDGVLSGIPSRAGMYRFTVKASDSSSPTKSISKVFALNVL